MLLIRRKSLSLCRRYSSVHAKPTAKPLSAVNQVLKYNAGDKIFGYTVKEVQEVPELHLAAIRLQHEKTDADHVHIARDDKNNVFSVALRTTPKDSTGVPHILEHLSLCGSQRFPCRDPFFKMRDRSLSTFMNAFTGNDYTMYPFSSQNPKDFENLLRVYLDAVFFPCLREKDFRQEGWRLEHEDFNDRNSPIKFKGVVFNEMKGVFSDPNQHFIQHLENKLYPSHAYAHVSGGDPLHIPTLTWTALKKFHAENYHPSNSRFFTYGDTPLEIHLESIEDYVLKKFSKINIDNSVIEEIPWKEPREAHTHCRFDPLAADPEKQTTVSTSYLLNEITDTHDTFAMSIISTLLIDGPNSPFYKSLLEPGIGADYSPNVGYEAQLKQGYFHVGLREISEKDVETVKHIIESTIDGVIKQGFPEQRIDGVLHNIELSLKHQTTSFGLHAAMAINALWNHGGNPISALKVNDRVQWFQKQIRENPHFLQEKVDQYFKQNNHKLTLIMTPSETYETEKQEEEENLLKTKLSTLTEKDKLLIFDEGIELVKYQETAEDLSSLPTLQICDVEKQIEHTPMQTTTLGGIPVQVCEQPTNGVVYFKAMANVPNLPEDLLMLLPLFSGIVTKMGAGERDYKLFDQEAELKTGGLDAGMHITEDPSHRNRFEHGIVFSSFCLQKNVDHMMGLWLDVFNSLHLKDHDRLSQLIKMAAADLAQGIPYQAHLYSMKKASSSLSTCANIREKMSGLAQVSYMKSLAELNNYDEVIGKLRTIADILLQKKSLRCAINASPSSLNPSLTSLEHFANSLRSQTSQSPHVDEVRKFQPVGLKTHFVLPFAVNYLGKSLLTVPYNHKDSASLKTAAKLLSSKYLHREIREKGGAYGGGATLTQGGAFMCYSYRDPNVSQTLESFDAGVQWLSQGNYSTQDIDEAKLGIFSEVDQPIAPGDKGAMHFLNGITDDMKQTLRENLFAVTKEDIVSATNRYLVKSELSSTSLIGPEHEISKSNNEWILHKE